MRERVGSLEAQLLQLAGFTGWHPTVDFLPAVEPPVPIIGETTSLVRFM